MDSHTRVSYQRNPGFLERIGQSLVGIVFGLIFLLVACGLLFWNEGRAVQTAKSLDEGLRTVIPLSNAQVVSLENNGKLIHLTGGLETSKVLSDEVYGVAVMAVKLNRKVEVYQWVEHVSENKYDEGGETRVEKTYSYSMEWRTEMIRSSSFDSPYRHENPTSRPVDSATFEADEVHVGGFVLSKPLVSKINDYKDVDVQNLQTPAGHKYFNGAFYSSHDPMHPQVGDLRVTFQYAGISGKTRLGPQTIVSIVARQVGSSLQAFRTYAGDDLEMLYVGDLSAKEMFGREQMNNTMLTWAVRFAGWLLMFIGFGCLTQILNTLVDWVPLVRNVVALGVCMMNMSLSISLSLTVIALGWIRYRPLLGFTILGMAMVPFIMSRLRPGTGSRSRQD